ncbi:MAG: hypothetical protein WDM92_02820 [Caulobacteraceae bacterium]
MFASRSSDPEIDAVRRRKLDSQPLLTMLEPVTFTGKEAAIRNRTYIYANGGEHPGFTRFYDQVKDDPRLDREDHPHRPRRDDGGPARTGADADGRSLTRHSPLGDGERAALVTQAIKAS